MAQDAWILVLIAGASLLTGHEFLSVVAR